MSDAKRACPFCGETDAGRLVNDSPATCRRCVALCRDIVGDLTQSPATRPELVCAFCGKDRRGVLVAGPTLYICNECVTRLSESN